MLFNPTEHPHKRYNILTGQWVLVLPEMTNETHKPDKDALDMLVISAFPENRPQLRPDTPDGERDKAGLLRALSEKGICRQIEITCLKEAALLAAVELLCNEYKKLSSNSFVRYIHIVQHQYCGETCNKSYVELWAHSSIPDETLGETVQQERFYEQNAKSLLSAYLDAELEENERVIMANQDFVVVKPYWARHAREALIVSRRQVLGIHEFSPAEQASFAGVWLELMAWYADFFEHAIPYKAAMYQSPVNDGLHPEWHWHMHFCPIVG